MGNIIIFHILYAHILNYEAGALIALIPLLCIKIKYAGNYPFILKYNSWKYIMKCVLWTGYKHMSPSVIFRTLRDLIRLF